MTEQAIRWHRDAEGIVTLTLDDPTQRVNTMNAGYRASMHATVQRLAAQGDKIAGVILTSAKSTFFAGGDLNGLYAVNAGNLDQFSTDVAQIRSDLRALETLGIPVVAALNGAALGGGLEIALACHYRIALAGARARFGLPEVKLGLLPGGGGTVRTVRMLGVVRALADVLLDGTQYDPFAAARVGLVDEVVDSPDQLLTRAKEWIVSNPRSVQRWEREEHTIPGGTVDELPLKGIVAQLPAQLRKKLKSTKDPAPHHILCAAVESVQVDPDTAFEIEGGYFVDLAQGQVAKNMIKAFWFDSNAVASGKARPSRYPTRLPEKVAVVGAGMMGAGIAAVTAGSGLPVVLKDFSLAAAERGKGCAAGLLDKRVNAGSLTTSGRDAALAKITPTADYADLKDSDLVIEAVCEDTALKRKVLREIEAWAAPDAVLGSNTSTLPITGLAEGVERKGNILGLHFFSPVDRMSLIEVIPGGGTSDEALARALDFAAHIKKTPIVVKDSRGFFTSRVLSAFVHEGVAMLGEGIAPSTIEQATAQAGFPVGVLQLADELNLELLIRIRDESRDATEAAGAMYQRHPAEAVVEEMVRRGRLGRLRGAGFFDYDARGRRLGVWPHLAELFPTRPDPEAVDLGDLEERLLIVQAIETTHCLAEGVIANAADANLGSILGIGFPAWTGGSLQYINSYVGRTGRGISAFVVRADELADEYGGRFRPSAFLRQAAAAGTIF